MKKEEVLTLQNHVFTVVIWGILQEIATMDMDTKGFQTYDIEEGGEEEGDTNLAYSKMIEDSITVFE